MGLRRYCQPKSVLTCLTVHNMCKMCLLVRKDLQAWVLLEEHMAGAGRRS